MARARRLVRGLLAGWGADEETRDTAVLVVSELFTNAVVHTGSGSVVCELRQEKGAAAEEGTPLRLEVSGRRPGPSAGPTSRTRPPGGGARPGAAAGRGRQRRLGDPGGARLRLVGVGPAAALRREALTRAGAPVRPCGSRTPPSRPPRPRPGPRRWRR
ncbi:ATP-binding protein [Streptomyces mangrovi]|uniref:ATP-binding protein n=1 Tax=Streptomyces mangrovi TaxID=1206892 RepID=UPI00399D3A69